MSWGVATQNGVSVSLASIVSLSCGATEFSPASLFTSGVAGAWYDPSDYSTLFQDSSGTTPVTAVEQPVRLMLDKSQGLVLGSELVTGAASAYSGNGTVATVGDTITATCTTNGIYGITWASTFVSNLWVLLTVEVVTNSASKSLLIFPNGNSTALAGGTTTGNKSFIALAPTATGSTRCPIFYINGLAGESFSVRLVSIKSYAGNHALAPNDLSRPVLRARYNLLTYSEQFDNAAWAVTGVTRSADVTTAPDGTATADRITGSSGINAILFPLTGYTAIAGNITISCYIKAGTADYAVLSLWSGSSSNGVNLWVNVQTGAIGSNSATAGYTFVSGSSTAVGNGWYRVVLTGTVPAGAVYFSLRLVDGDNAFSYTNTVGKTLFVWGADLRTGSSAGTYQRIAAATDYATAGFLPYLYFVTDDSFGTNSIDFTATDKMAVCAGLTKLSDATIGGIAELSADANSNAGVFWLFAPSAANGNDFNFRSRGVTASFPTAQKTSVPSPVTAVLTGLADISGDVTTLRYNGSLAQTVTTDQGTGNYGNYPLYIGRRNNATLPFNGNLYQMIVCGKTLSASELASTEAYVATKTGVTL